MSILTKNQRLSMLERKVDQLEKLLSVKDKPVLNQLDQSVFIGLDSKWKYAAIDENGKTHLYEDIPKICDSSNLWVNTSGSFKLFSKKFITTNWQDSLIKREAEAELTGNDLCRAMLARGDKFIPCFTYNGPKDNPIVTGHNLVTEFDQKRFRTTGSFIYHNVIPINNQGEPLTASEVGL